MEVESLSSGVHGILYVISAGYSNGGPVTLCMSCVICLWFLYRAVHKRPKTHLDQARSRCDAKSQTPNPTWSRQLTDETKSRSVLTCDFLFLLWWAVCKEEKDNDFPVRDSSLVQAKHLTTSRTTQSQTVSTAVCHLKQDCIWPHALPSPWNHDLCQLQTELTDSNGDANCNCSDDYQEQENQKQQLPAALLHVQILGRRWRLQVRHAHARRSDLQETRCVPLLWPLYFSCKKQTLKKKRSQNEQFK